MSFEIVFASSFKRSIKRLQNRFPHVKDDVQVAISTLLKSPKLGTVIPEGKGVRKLRVRNTDISKGKSSGYRLIYFVEDWPEPTIFLLLLYYKSDKDDITSSELKRLLQDLSDEMV